MRIATWNIYWLGDRSGTHITRSAADEQLIAEVIRRLQPDVLALQEIVDPSALERILATANETGRDYTIRQGASWLSADRDPTGPQNLQKAFLCFDKSAVDFIKGSALHGGPFGRDPYAAVLRHRASGQEFVAVVVHLRSGFPAFLDAADADRRRQEAAALAAWLQGAAEAKNPEFPRPKHPDVVVLGDFNAELVDPNRSLDPLALPGWTWSDPAPDGPHRETALFAGDRHVIDFILFSPTLSGRLRTPPAVYAWDYDPELGGPSRFHAGVGGSDDLLDYRVSDHRPVVAVLDF